MAKEIETTGEFPFTVFKVGQFCFACHEETVMVTKNAKDGLHNNIATYNYEGKGKKDDDQKESSLTADWEAAEEAAWRMAVRQSKA